MKFTTTRKALLSAVAQAAAVTDAKASLTVLANVKLEANTGDDAIAITGTDTYTTVTALVTATIDKPGSCLVDAKTLRDICGSLPESGGDVHAEIELTKLTLRCGKARRTIAALDAEDYPMLAKEPECPVTLASEALLRAISTVEHAMSTDETRPTLAGVMLVCERGKVTAKTTDGHRLTQTEGACETGAFECLLPARGVAAMKRALAEHDGITKIGADASHATMRCGDVTTTMRLAGAAFPPTDRLIPRNHPHVARVNRTMLLDAVRGARVTAKQEGKELADAMAITFAPGEIRVEAQGTRGESSDAVDCDYAGKVVSIGFQPKYLIDALAAIAADEVAIAFNGPLDPILVTPALTNETQAVVMPQRLGNG